jgi:hypothetical protein
MKIYRSLRIAIYGSLLLCFEANAEPEQELSCATLTYFFALWKDSGFGRTPWGLERAAWIIRDSDGKQIFQKWRNSAERNKEIWKGPIPENAVGVVHTHPVQRDSKPSPADITMAKKLNIHVYTVSRKGLWMSTPNGEISRIMDHTRFKELVKGCCPM